MELEDIVNVCSVTQVVGGFKVVVIEDEISSEVKPSAGRGSTDCPLFGSPRSITIRRSAHRRPSRRPLLEYRTAAATPALGARGPLRVRAPSSPSLRFTVSPFYRGTLNGDERCMPPWAASVAISPHCPIGTIMAATIRCRSIRAGVECW